MVRFKQKEFFAWIPVLATMGTSAAVDGTMGAIGNAQQEEANEEQARLLREQNRIIKRSAENQLEQQREQARIMARAQKHFGMLGFAKDIFRAARKGGFAESLAKTAAIGGSFAGATYVGNKVVQGMQNSDAKKEEAAYAQQAQQTQYSFGSIMKAAGKEFVSNINPVKRNAAGKLTGNFGGIATWGLGVGLPVGGYLMSKKNQNNMVSSQQGGDQYIPQPQNYSETYRLPRVSSQREYSVWSSIAKFGGKAVDKVGSFLSFGYGGSEAASKGLTALSSAAKDNTTKKFVDWAGRHKKLVTAASIPIGMGISSAAMGAGDKIVNAPLRAIDPKAFANEDQQNQSIQ